jgi:hypothetical protein
VPVDLYLKEVDSEKEAMKPISKWIRVRRTELAFELICAFIAGIFIGLVFGRLIK